MFKAMVTFAAMALPAASKVVLVETLWRTTKGVFGSMVSSP